jgi:serine/threonine protein kinase
MMFVDVFGSAVELLLFTVAAVTLLFTLPASASRREVFGWSYGCGAVVLIVGFMWKLFFSFLLARRTMLLASVTVENFAGVDLTRDDAVLLPKEWRIVHAWSSSREEQKLREALICLLHEWGRVQPFAPLPVPVRERGISLGASEPFSDDAFASPKQPSPPPMPETTQINSLIRALHDPAKPAKLYASSNSSPSSPAPKRIRPPSRIGSPKITPYTSPCRAVMGKSVTSPQNQPHPLASKNSSFAMPTLSTLVSSYPAEEPKARVATVVCVLIRVPLMDNGIPTSQCTSAAVNVMSEIAAVVAECCDGVIYRMELTALYLTFNAQTPCVEHERHAVVAALNISDILVDFCDSFDATFGIGVSQSTVLVGEVGSSTRRAFTITGFAMVEALRLAELNFVIHTHVLISEKVHDSTQGEFVTLLVDFVCDDAETIPWRSNPSNRSYSAVFEIRGEDCIGDPSAEQIQRLPHEVLVFYMESFIFLRTGDYQRAKEHLDLISAEHMEDPQLRRIAQLADFFMANPSKAPPKYARHHFAVWEDFEDSDVLLDRTLSSTVTLSNIKGPCSPSRRGKAIAVQFHDSPTRIIDAVHRARSESFRAESAPTSGHESPNTAECASVEFLDVADVRWLRSDKMLGKGAFGEVFLGMRVEDGKLVAMKQLRIPELISNTTNARQARRYKEDNDALEQLIKEIRLLCALRHPNIVFFLGCGIVNHDIIINLELVSGGSLQDMLEHFTLLPVSAVQRYLKDILRGLDFLHSKEIIHRDVKPANVLLHIDGSCKITDFGTSVQIQNIVDNNIVVGTPLYMSPEQAKGPQFTCFQSDLWSVGIMTIQLLTGEPPFNVRGLAGSHQHMRRLATDPEFRATIPPLPPGAADFVGMCLRYNPDERSSAKELLMHPFLFSSPHGSRTPMKRVASGSHSPPDSADAMSPLTRSRSKVFIGNSQ